MHKILWGMNGQFRFEIKGKHKMGEQDYLFSIWVGPLWIKYSIITPMWFARRKSGEEVYSLEDGKIIKKVVK